MKNLEHTRTKENSIINLHVTFIHPLKKTSIQGQSHLIYTLMHYPILILFGSKSPALYILNYLLELTDRKTKWKNIQILREKGEWNAVQKQVLTYCRITWGTERKMGKYSPRNGKIWEPEGVWFLACSCTLSTSYSCLSIFAWSILKHDSPRTEGTTAMELSLNLHPNKSMILKWRAVIPANLNLKKKTLWSIMNGSAWVVCLYLDQSLRSRKWNTLINAALVTPTLNHWD